MRWGPAGRECGCLVGGERREESWCVLAGRGLRVGGPGTAERCRGGGGWMRQPCVSGDRRERRCVEGRPGSLGSEDRARCVWRPVCIVAEL